MKKIILALAALAGFAAFAVPAAASAAPVPCPAEPPTGTTVHIRLANCMGGPAGDLGRGIRITTAGAVQLRTSNLANLRLTHLTDPSGTRPLVTFYIQYGSKYLRVSKTGAKLGATPMLFGESPGGGFNGPRWILRARADGHPLASNLGLTAAGTVLKLAPATLASPDSTPNWNQVWITPFTR